MRKYISLLLGASIATILISSCAAVGAAVRVANVAAHTGVYAGEVARSVHNLRTIVGNHKTAYGFELLSVVNDAGINDGQILCPRADSESKALYQDGFIALSFEYEKNCIVLGMKTTGRTYTTIRWSDVIMDENIQMNGRPDVVTLNHSSFSEGELYVVYDRISKTCRTFPLYVSQKKADEDGIAGSVFKLTFPVVRSDEVVTYTMNLRIADVTVD